MDDRAVGWLDNLTHARVRELLLHMSITYQLVVPVYCLMPDHLHLLMGGIAPEADQKKGVSFFRKHLNKMLETSQKAPLQKQAFDHVLQEAEREHGAFQAIATYILDNPVRKELVEEASKWPYSGCMVAGHPGWDVFHPEYFDSYWKLYQERREKNQEEKTTL